MPTTRIPFPVKGYAGKDRMGVIFFSHSVTTGASGAIASQDDIAGTGLGAVVAKTATKTGRYTITLPKAYKKLVSMAVALIGPDDAAYAANNQSGLAAVWRDNDIDGGAKDGTIELQFVRGDTYADAELPNNTAFKFTIVVAEGI